MMLNPQGVYFGNMHVIWEATPTDPAANFERGISRRGRASSIGRSTR